MRLIRLGLVWCVCVFAVAGKEAVELGQVIDLSGHWQVRLDPQDVGESEKWYDRLEGSSIQLPGIATEIGLGDPLTLEPALTKEVFEYLHQKFRYVGAAWYVRDIELAEAWKDASLLLERTIWKTTVWINGKKLGSKDSLSTPHRHSVGDVLKTGKNMIAVRVDNRMQVDIGDYGHAYTDQTQTIWNGLIGKMELQHNNPVQIKTHPLRVVVPENGKMKVLIEPVNHDGPKLPVISRVVKRGEVTVELPSDKIVKWSEFNPALYRVTVDFDGQEKSILTGFRDVETKGRKLLINGRPSFMRGTLECCIFPKTGYPPTDAAGWDKVFGTLKEYGLNHIRFHSWCPPEAAFASADRYGIYIQAELPNWTFKMGQDPEVDGFLMKEGERIIREYGHHPSFVFFSLGNELTGDYREMDRMVERLRMHAPHLLYTSTTYSFSKRGALSGPADDFFISQKTQTGWVRGQGFINQTWPTTISDYVEGLSCLEIPLITHEVGQYNVYPNLAELPKYNGNLRALGYEAIRQDLQKKGRLDNATALTHNSGKLAAILYKEDIERALRTPGLSGIQLLDLHDFPGQSTATVGLLDSFWDSKGIILPAEFRRFCAPVVPLLKMEKRAWKNNETFTAKIEVADFGETPVDKRSIRWTIQNEVGKTLAEKTGSDDGIRFQLSKVRKASRLKVTVSVGDYSNDWGIWVYPVAPPVKEGEVVIVRRYGKTLFNALSSGKKVLFLPSREEIAKPLDGRFIPVFWSPLHFPNQAGSLGTVIDDKHPVFDDFPTSTHTDWQWWELLATSTSINADELGADFSPVMQFIDKFNRNSLPAILWEARVGTGELFVCTLDVESDPQKRMVAAQLKNSILSYMKGDRFSPQQILDIRQLAALFQMQPYVLHLENGTEHPDYPLTNLQDGDAKTIWHSDWRNQSTKHPYNILIEFPRQTMVNGLDYIPRQGNPNGRVARYRVSVSLDGKSWRNLDEGNHPPERIRFKKPERVTRIRFEALSEVNGTDNCSIAELKPVFEGNSVGVDDLGLIDGFNTGN